MIHRRGLPRGVSRALPYLLLALAFGLGMTQVVRASITFDEGPHLAVGYTTLRTRDLRLQPVHIHPPLANVLAGAPLLFQRDLPDPAQVEGWEIASLSALTDAIVWSYPHPRRIAVAGRMPILLLNALIGAMVYRWAHDLGGRHAALPALFLYALDPNAIAHGALITTDTGAVLFSVATLYALYRALRTPSAPRRRRLLALTGVLLGLAQLTKVSALMLVPVAALVLLAEAWARSRQVGYALQLAALRTLALIAIAALVVWAGYGFELRPIAEGGIPVPAATHIEIFRSLNEHYDLGHPTFALGRVSSHGWWWYFPLAFVLKTPLPVLLLTLVSVALVAGYARRRFSDILHLPNRAVAATALGLFPLLYAGASLFSTVNIGYRHLLPILPFMYITVAMVLTRRDAVPTLYLRPARGLLAASLAWLTVSTLGTLPYPLTFFNELAGGASGGYRALVDSNLDWGQNLWDLSEWMGEHGERHVNYAHFSPARPQAYKIDAGFLPPDPRAVPFAPWYPAPGLYAIGATVLQGAYAPDINTFAWFRDREPLARLGHALFLYRVEERPRPTWVVLCTSTLEADDVHRRLGTTGLRIIQPDCAQTRVYRDTTEPGLVVTAGSASTDEVGEPQFTLRNADGGIEATVYRISRDDGRPGVAAHAEDRIEGPLTFLGHTIVETAAGEQTAWIVRTHWQVRSIPSRPLSLMAHLVGAQGTPLAVGDGLGFPIEQWQAGDIIVQTHRLEPAGDVPGSGPLSLHVGAYWLDTMARWATAGGGDAIVLEVGTQP